ncbi:Glutamyl-tRNA(Gln) amidotransferase subunit A [Roseivivax jejudonensis]|uniref:Glutamyl-tRNA(Gln) amidotransferase subunit A n=1 Tax=Roseivivax jejudonensis TaxID=1529041 RepID=A0A1X6ZWB1_9RHOB|nr:amidase [Roseivivax jejudonensis]SLN63718.1 Glutamyl-tRNA(Gln) amidotransferase subunit A [Roseivivax jejudonensis]
MPEPASLLDLGAADLRDRLADGALSARAVVTACCERIASRDGAVGAWAWIDPERALAAAERLDARFARSGPVGPLHGLPVGLKDIIDTAGIPTENGCARDRGRVPERDAALVTRLTAAGAIVLGKTVTTELAFLEPARTRNPRNLRHTPGGSSSGSAAAVADGMVPLAVGTQTGGSLLRPAAYCGVTGFKPSFGAIPRAGVLTLAPGLDTAGTMARDPAGAALLAGVLGAPVGGDAGPRGRAPTFAFVTMPGWEAADPALHRAFADLRKRLGARVVAAELPAAFARAPEAARDIALTQMARSCSRYMTDGGRGLSARTRGALEAGARVPEAACRAAVEVQAALGPALAPIFARCDAILCAAAPGPAPEGLHDTGDAAFTTPWTLAGTPAITLPLLSAPNGLPMGVQLVGPVGGDARLLRAAAWLWAALRG